MMGKKFGPAPALSLFGVAGMNSPKTLHGSEPLFLPIRVHSLAKTSVLGLLYYRDDGSLVARYPYVHSRCQRVPLSA
jgi:hypothetical protein